MKSKLVTAILVLSGCNTGSEPFFCKTTCGLSIAASNKSPQFDCDDYIAIESILIPKISDEIPGACSKISGATAWELPGFSTKLGGSSSGKELWAAGWTECLNRRIFFHTGDGFMFKDDQTIPRMAWNTAFAHEIIHLAQNCDSKPPIDPGQDESHSDWTRLGFEVDLYNVFLEMEASK